MEDSRTKNASKNIISAFLLQIIKIVFVLANRIIFVRTLGASFLGINGLFSNILSILSLADLGLGTAMMYGLYEPLAKKDERKISAYINFFNKVYNIIAIIVAITGVALIPFLKYIINLPNTIDHIYLYYILQLSSTVMSYLFVYKTTLLSADQKNYIITKYDFIMSIVLFFAQMIILITTKSFGLYLFANVVTMFMGNILKVRKTNELYPYIKKSNAELSKEERKEIFSNTNASFAYKIGGIIQSNTDNILISMFVGTITVGYYSNYSSILNYIVNFISTVFNSLKASLGNFIAEKSKDEQMKLFDIFETINFGLVSFCTIMFTILISDFIEICYGKEYILNNAFVIGLALNFYTSNIRQNLWMYRETTGMFKKTKYITLVTSAFNIVLSIWWGKYWGLSGIVYATVFSRIIYAWWKEPIIIFNDYFKKSSKKYFIKYIERIIFTLVQIFAFQYMFKLIKIQNIYLLFIIKGLITSIITLLIFYIVYKKDSAFYFLMEKLKKGRLNKKWKMKAK